MIYNRTLKALTLTVAVALAGCIAVLPNSSTKSEAKWKTYDEAKAAFDSIKLGKTTDADLKSLGFDAQDLPNIRIINYVDVAGLFGSAFDKDSLPDGVKKCLNAKDDCYAYVARVQNISSKRNGNVAADLFGFKKQTHTTGWELQATLVLIDKTVVYKMWAGTPEIDTMERQSSPLGPMQNLGFIFPKPF